MTVSEGAAADQEVATPAAAEAEAAPKTEAKDAAAESTEKPDDAAAAATTEKQGSEEAKEGRPVMRGGSAALATIN